MLNASWFSCGLVSLYGSALLAVGFRSEAGTHGVFLLLSRSERS